MTLSLIFVLTLRRKEVDFGFIITAAVLIRKRRGVQIDALLFFFGVCILGVVSISKRQ